MEKAPGMAVDIEEAEQSAAEDVIQQREEALAKKLMEQQKKKKKLVDPLQFEMSIQAEDLSSYVPAFGWECSPASEKQLQALEKFGIYPDEIDNAGKASLLLDRLNTVSYTHLDVYKRQNCRGLYVGLFLDRSSTLLTSTNIKIKPLFKGRCV